MFNFNHNNEEWRSSNNTPRTIVHYRNKELHSNCNGERVHQSLSSLNGKTPKRLAPNTAKPTAILGF